MWSSGPRSWSFHTLRGVAWSSLALLLLAVRATGQFTVTDRDRWWGFATRGNTKASLAGSPKANMLIMAGGWACMHANTLSTMLRSCSGHGTHVLSCAMTACTLCPCMPMPMAEREWQHAYIARLEALAITHSNRTSAVGGAMRGVPSSRMPHGLQMSTATRCRTR